MPEIPLIVEGGTDLAFFNRLTPLESFPPNVSLVPGHVGGSRQKIQDAVKAQLSAGTEQIIVAEDLNGRNAQQVVQSHRDSVSNHLESPAISLSDPQDLFQIGDVTLAVIPMGLQNDPDLIALGITNHAMEDYLIKLLLLDEGLRRAVPGFGNLVSQLASTIRSYNVPFDSSKDFFQLIKPIIKEGYSDTGVLEGLFWNSNPAMLRRVTGPLLERLERAGSVQPG